MSNFSWSWTERYTPQRYLEQIALFRLHLALHRFLTICNNIFKIIDQCKFSFRSVIGPDVRISVFKSCIILLIWAALVLFYLKQNQRLLVWNFIENASFISLFRRIWSRYFETNNFKTSKDLFFQK